jgi:hypothetical protein
MDVRDILQNSADPFWWWGFPGVGYMEPVHRQGAGMVDIDDAILQTTIVSPGKISLGESEAGPHTVKLIIDNTSDETVTYTLSTAAAAGYYAIATTGTFPDDEGIGYWLSGEMVEFSKTEITIKPHRHKSVYVTIYPEEPFPPVGFDNVQYGGWLTITPDDGSDVIRVPYAGFIGDYQSIEVLTESGYGPAYGAPLPALAFTPDGNAFGWPLPAGVTFTMEGFDTPWIAVHLHHQPRFLSGVVYDAATDEPLHPVFSSGFEDEYLPRNSSNFGFFAFEWDGTRLHSNSRGKLKTKFVEDGEYYIVLTVLKALGDPANPDHWETWTSPTFFIDRP